MPIAFRKMKIANYKEVHFACFAKTYMLIARKVMLVSKWGRNGSVLATESEDLGPSPITN